MNDKDLLAAAKEVMKRSYSPYSKYAVGSAVLMKDGTVFTGTNVENVNFANGICAERSAFASAISAGKRDFSTVAVATRDIDAWPCGLCRQVISEFGQDIRIIVEGPNGTIKEMRIGELLPNR